MDHFDHRKAEILAFVVDKSPKGSIDEHAKPLLGAINQCQDLVTTSSCSGRIAVYVDASPNNLEKVRKGGVWLSVSHDPLPNESSSLWQALFPNHSTTSQTLQFCSNATLKLDDPIVYFKFEPFILHVLARNHTAADELVTTALKAGYANTGIQRHVVQMKDTLKLDVPIGTYRGGVVELCVSKEYIEFLVELSNDKFRANFAKMDKFQKLVETDLVEKPTEVPTETREQRKERKQREGLILAVQLKEARKQQEQERVQLQDGSKVEEQQHYDSSA
ncbi:hypothetical protein HDU85_005396 [Gaertneriomyces sp. JEL0708]|nr:hypothetical protein HDU85_005396 [Gaertneriomyces sp. JEL0708]